MTKIKKLHLHDFHLNNSARFTDFAGWSMPVSYGSSVDEHLHTRKYASLFDVSHMGEISVIGPDATSFLDYILTNNINDVVPGKALYSPLCNKNGGTIDDLIIYKKDTDDYLLCVNASNVGKDFLHMLSHLGSFNCEIKNISSNLGQIAIQGPLSEKILSSILEYDLSGLSKMSFIEDDFSLCSALIARTGYTGEDGFEIYCNLSDLKIFAEAFQEFVTNKELKWGGLAARDSLRLEAGFPLHGNELSESISPVQAGISWAVSWNKKSFVGRDCLLNEKNKGSSGKVLFYETDNRRTPRTGDNLFFNGKLCGRVLSGGFSPLLKKPIGTVWVDAENFKNQNDDMWSIKVRNTDIQVNLSLPVLKRFKN